MKKRTLSLILAALFALTAIAVVPVFAVTHTSGAWKYIIEDVGKASITKYLGTGGGNVTIPSELDGYTIIAIGNYTFEDCDDITGVTIPDTVTEIGAGAFLGCTSLKSITIPDAVIWINQKAFWCCSSLESVTIPLSVATISQDAFAGCDSLANVYYAGSETQWSKITVRDGNEALLNANIKFNGTDTEPDPGPGPEPDPSDWEYEINGGKATVTKYIGSADNVTIPDSLDGYTVTGIGNDAFYGCASLKSVTVGDSVTEIGSYAFCNCASLTSVTIPGSVTGLGNNAFSNCTALKSVTIKGAVSSIGSETFYNCTALTQVTIPGSVTLIDIDAFSYCNSLTKVYFGGSEAQWNSITVKSGNDVLKSAEIVFASAGASGDVNGDGKVNAKDVTAIMKHLVGNTPANFILSAADTNGDGKINAKDVTWLMKKLVG